MFLSELEKVKEHFIFGSACSLGLITDALIDFNEAKAERFIELFDYLEIQALTNNAYLILSEDYPAYKTEEDLKALNRRIFEFAKKHNKKVCFTSDAHVIDKTERFKRSMFKKPYMSMIKKSKDPDFNAAETLHDSREGIQPFLHSYDDMVNELQTQGFSDEEIDWIYNNEKEIFEQCSYFNNTVIIPDQMFIPDFPGVNVKTEVPKIAYETLLKMYGENYDPLIKERLDSEIEALAKRDFEFIYYTSMRCIEESRKLGYEVGSRGFAPLNWLS